MKAVLQIAGVIPGPPFDPGTWSGSSRHLFRSMERAGVLVDAIDARPFAGFAYLAKLLSFSRDTEVWRQKYDVDALSRSLISRTAARRLRQVEPRPNVSFQIGAWCDLTDLAGGRLVRSSYHDGNLAVYLMRPDLRIDLTTRRVRKAFERERKTYDGLDVIFTMSEWLRSSFINDFNQDASKVIAVGAGANLYELPDVPPRAGHSPTFLFVGKDFERKGGRILLDAFAEVRAIVPEARLLIVGPRGLEAPPEGVTFLGRIQRGSTNGERAFDELYRSATAFVMPSNYEPFGIAFLEAMSYNLPCIGTNTCAMPEIISHERTGYIVSPGSTDELIEAMSRVATDPEHAAAMGVAARARVEKDCTWDIVVRRITSALIERFV